MTTKNLTYAEASAFLGIPRNTLYTLVAERRIPHIRLGRRFVRFSTADLEHWLRRKAVPLQQGEQAAG
ncbi:MAG: helix-turn-helix domain-containing protein [Myxococcales bacterium]|nr:helix-turn-helix domain-containing protein [Myxococcales bacterium]